MTTQQQAAMASMVDWLAHENELGMKPTRIEIAGEFDLHGMHYYIFKYKKNLLDKWLLGVCGGYENPMDTEHCGHVFSEMQPYIPETAEQEAIAMVEMIREYWLKRAAEIEAAEAQMQGDSSDENEENTEYPEAFNGFVLLNTHECDLEMIKAHLLRDWNITYNESDDEGQIEQDKDGMLVFEVEGCTVAVGYMDTPVPNGEAEYFAQSNYLWREAVETTKTHVAHIIVAVLNSNESSPLDRGKLYVKLASSCLKLPNAIGIYTSGTVFQPALFVQLAEVMKSEDEFPLLNLIHFGLVGSEAGVSGYTVGMNLFGKDEIEVIDSQTSPTELRDFLIDIAGYVIEQDVVLRDGETIGFSAEHRLPITRSNGVYVEGNSLKIKF